MGKAYRVPRTLSSNPKLFMFETFTKGRHSINHYNYCSQFEQNETMCISFTVHHKIVEEFRVSMEEFVRICLDELVGFHKLEK